MSREHAYRTSRTMPRQPGGRGQRMHWPLSVNPAARVQLTTVVVEKSTLAPPKRTTQEWWARLDLFR